MGVRAKKTRRAKVVKIVGKTPKKEHRARTCSANPLSGELNTQKLPLEHSYASMGLQNTPGLAQDKKLKILRSVPEKHKRPMPPVPEPAPAKGTHVTEMEHGFIDNLIEKHGTDYKAMSRDLKLNPFQFTAKQLRKKVLRIVKIEQKIDPGAFKDVYGDKTVEEIVGEVSSDGEW